MRRCAPPSTVPTKAARCASFYEPGLSVAVELLLLRRRLPSPANTALGFVSRKESVFRCCGGFGERITSGSDTDEDFEARGTGRRERADGRPMATVVAGDDCAEPILGGGARSLSHSGRREELATCVAPGFRRGGRARGARAPFVFSPTVDAVNGARLLMVVEDPQKMPSTVSE